ncbi:hypothetical protein MLD38_011792 [Melastoma candidum]|uniref:Uncharacterized protein n=1 Tax=Melastoma candidum TaxID=119954 RepID=A0ACB9R485_9MYRT|nr:hypothetical protein MLD38_011792 [Melastoma candidum]
MQPTPRTQTNFLWPNLKIPTPPYSTVATKKTQPTGDKLTTHPTDRSMSDYAVESTKVPAPDNVGLHRGLFKPTTGPANSSGPPLHGTGRVSGFVGWDHKWVGG